MMVVPEDGMIIDARHRRCSLVCITCPTASFIAEDGITLDGNGALLIGKDFNGCGVTCERSASA